MDDGKIIVDAFLQRNKTQRSFAISAVTENPMIDDAGELAHLQIEQNLRQARHDVPVNYRAADLEEDKKVREFISTGSYQSTAGQYRVMLLNLAVENSTTS